MEHPFQKMKRLQIHKKSEKGGIVGKISGDISSMGQYFLILATCSDIASSQDNYCLFTFPEERTFYRRYSYLFSK